MVNIIIDDRLPPVPGWLLCYLSQVVPSNLAVTNLHVKQDNDSWKLQLAGTAKSITDQPNGEAFANSVALLTKHLSEGPFHVAIRSDSQPEAETPKNGFLIQ